MKRLAYVSDGVATFLWQRNGWHGVRGPLSNPKALADAMLPKLRGLPQNDQLLVAEAWNEFLAHERELGNVA